MDFLLSLILVLVVLHGGLNLYFVNWVLWRWNTVLTKMNIEQHLSTRSEEE